MKTRAIVIVLVILAVSLQTSGAETTAQRRAGRLGYGMNLSYLDNWWLGSKEANYADFAKADEAAKREKMLADIAREGFKTVRVPICFGAWASLRPPYRWDNKGPGACGPIREMGP